MTAAQFSPIVQNDLIATIANGQTTSGIIDLAGCSICGFHMPAAFTGTSLKILTATSSGGTFQNVLEQGIDYSITVAAGKYVPIENLAIVAGIKFIKIVSGSAEGADRVITLAVRPV
jgi:hypothetical protein